MKQKVLYSALAIVAILATFKFFAPTTITVGGAFFRPSYINKKQGTPKKEDLSPASKFDLPDFKNKTVSIRFPPEVDMPFRSKKRSKKILKLFKKKTYLDIPDMDDYLFEDYSQDNIAILVGKNYKNEVLTILAARLSIDPGQFDALLREDRSLLPLSDPAIFEGNFTLADSYKKKINGFSEVSAYTKERGGKLFTIFHAPRADGKGTYGMVLEGKKKEIMGNYDYYERKFMGFKARNE